MQRDVMAAAVSVAAVLASDGCPSASLASLLAPSFAYGLWISRVAAEVEALEHQRSIPGPVTTSHSMSSNATQAADLCSACSAHFEVESPSTPIAATVAESTEAQCMLCAHRETSADWEDRALSLSEPDAGNLSSDSDSDSSDGDSEGDQEDADADSVCSSSSDSSDSEDGAPEDPLSTWRAQMLVILDPPELRGREKRVWLNKVHQRLTSRLAKNLHPERASTKLPSTFSRSRLFRCTGPQTPLFKDF